MQTPRKLKTRELIRLSTDEYKTSEKIPAVVILDNIRSAYNVGAIFRTVDGFRIDKIILCGITPCPPNKEIYKTAIGAENSVEWTHIPDVMTAVSELKNHSYHIIGLEQTTSSILLSEWSWPLNQKIGIILGNEVEGMNADLLPLCDSIIEIPQFGTKHSFNVSVAAGIILWDLVKNNLKK
jgi:23S rRNA (guanosine2251-2'-O)-methyltransferase